MRKILLLALVAIAWVSCKKSSDDSNGNSTADYELSADGRTLIKWKNANTTELNMEADSRLRNVNTIGKEAFKEHQNLVSITFPNNLKEIEESAFEEANLSGEVMFNTKATVNFGEKAFQHCHLKKITLPNMKVLGISSLSICRDLKEVTFSKVAKLDIFALRDCQAASLNFEGTGLIEIEHGVFVGMWSLKEITLPETLTKIQSNAFWDCRVLKKITIKAVNPPVLHVNGIFGTKDKSLIPTIYVPKGSVERYKKATGWSDFAEKIQAIN
ncbi:hypothetical protein RCZ04_09450 [Capnocytophaga sp. HP1101]